MGNHNIITFLNEQVADQPHGIAIVDTHHGLERATTFDELQRKSALVASELQHRGLRHSDVVLLLHEVNADLYVLLLALFRIGAVAMFVDVSASGDELRHCLKISPPDAVMASAKGHLLELLLSLRRAHLPEFYGHSPRRFTTLPFMPGAVSLHAAMRKSRPNSPAAKPLTSLIPPSQPALITFTSGSTGLPKAIVRTHEFLTAQHDALSNSLKMAKGKIELTNLPIFVLANIASGMTSIIPKGDLRKPGKIDPLPIIEQLQREKVTRITASPAFLERLILGCEQSAFRLDSLQEIYTGGGPVFPAFLRSLRRHAPNADIVTVYGSTEAEPIAHLRLDEMTAADLQAMDGGGGLLVGRPEASVEVRIIDFGASNAGLTSSNFDSHTLSPAHIGEIVVTGKAVIKGYLDGVGDDETKMKVGSSIWHRTGDAGYFDADGRLWLFGRASARISDRRGIVFPFQIEHLGRASDQRFACISRGDRRTLFVEAGSLSSYLIPTLRRHRLRRCLRQLKGKFEFDDVVMLPHLPTDRRHNSKIAYAKLRDIMK